ncbi:MAG: NAD-dependent 4,6-dehydratase LegB [bacterium]
MTTRALVTGADGFIGSHLTELLLNRGYKVTALCQYNSFNDWGWLNDVEPHNNLTVVSGDIRDSDFCKVLTKDIDVVFHLAALIAIPYSYIAPSSYVATNVSGTLNICSAARDNSCSRIIHTSTSEVYGTAQYVPIDEKHPLQPQSPYSASKISADAMAMSFYNSFDLPLIIARPFNTYGPRQSARAVIPTIISQIAAGNSEILIGDVAPTRDFSYVMDTCNGIVALSECDSAVGKTVNIGTNYEISIGETLDLIKQIMDSDIEFKTDSARLRPKKSEVERLWCDNTLLNELTGFKPSTDIHDGLSQTIEWFVNPENLKKYKSGIYNI